MDRAKSRTKRAAVVRVATVLAAFAGLSISTGACQARAVSAERVPATSAVAGLIDMQALAGSQVLGLEARDARSGGEIKVAARGVKKLIGARPRGNRDGGAKNESDADAPADPASIARSPVAQPVVRPAAEPVAAALTGLGAAPAGCYAGCGGPPASTASARKPSVGRSVTKPATTPAVTSQTQAQNQAPNPLCFAGCGTTGPITAAPASAMVSEMRATTDVPSTGQVRVLRGVTRSKVYGVPN